MSPSAETDRGEPGRQRHRTVRPGDLAELVDHHGVEVYAFGLLTSFQGRLFPATARWLELADERSELQVEARCWCGARATHNARLIDGAQTFDGDLLVVGDTPPSAPDPQTTMELDERRVTYELLCRAHWAACQPTPEIAGQTAAEGEQT